LLQVYVRAYQDSNGDGVGDLRGLIQRLDYIKDLGVAGIWLMPIAKSQDRDHGYAVSDYRDVETDYGTLADVDELLRQAHARGLGVILDHVMNHSAAQNAAFVNSRAAINNPFRDWYLWAAPKPVGWNVFGSDPWRVDTSAAATGAYYAPFWDQMPDMNLRNPAVVNWHKDHLRFWLNRGVDGFRFDAVGLLIENGPTAWENQAESRALMGDINSLLATYSKRYLVCEAPSASISYAAADACGSAFAFGHNGDLIAAAKGDTAALARVAAFPSTAPATMARFLSNHDAFAGDRLWNQFNGNLEQHRLATAMLLLLPGVPFIYYGEEIGMAAASAFGDDSRLRTPMSWTGDATRAGFTTGTPFRRLSDNVATFNAAAQQADANSLRSFYKGLLNLRSARPSLRQGSYAVADQTAGLFAFLREQGAEQSVVALNAGSAAATLQLRGLTPNARYTSVWPADGTSFGANASGQASLNLPVAQVRVYARQ
jgi:alpha-amylase